MKIIVPLLLVLLFLLPKKVSEACVSFDNSLYTYSFLDSKIVAEDSEYAPYFLNFSEMYDYYQEVQEAKKTENLEEWRLKTCDYADLTEIEAVIYQGSETELLRLKNAVKAKNPVPGGRLRDNGFAKYLMSNGCEETLDYLVFAKQTEPHVTAVNAWGDTKRDYAAMKDLQQEGRKRFRKTGSHFLKLRYAYQLMRLAHYRKDYIGVLALHEDLMPKIDEVLVDELRSLMYWWILGHKAGALMALNQKAEANYLYSRIFAKCPSKRESAFRSFSVKNREEWEAVLKLCRSDRERSVIYALRANAADSRAIYDMEVIYDLYPESPHLEVLLVKEIEELEQDLLGLDWNKKKKQNKRNYKIPRAEAGDYVIELQKFARRLRLEGKVARPSLWYIAEGYLEFLAGDLYAAAKTFDEVRPTVEEIDLQLQLASFELALKIAAFETPDDETERAAYEIIKSNDLYETNKSFPNYLRDRLTLLYQENKRPGKAFRTQYDLKDLRANPQEDIIDDLLKIAQKPDRNPLERLYIRTKDDDLITDDLWDMKAVLAMQEFQLEAALLALKKIPRTEWDKFGRFDAFRPTINDCQSCAHSKDSIDLFNRGTLIQEILDLEYQARAEIQKAPISYFKIGVALYNTTYFGHSWRARDYYRSGAVWYQLKRAKDNVFPVARKGFPFGNKELIDVARAKYYFEKCRILTENPELAAQATYMAAKCELIEYYQSEMYKPAKCANCIPEVPEEYTEEYQRLKEQYGETKFYARIIEECAFFAAYARR